MPLEVLHVHSHLTRFTLRHSRHVTSRHPQTRSAPPTVIASSLTTFLDARALSRPRSRLLLGQTCRAAPSDFLHALVTFLSISILRRQKPNANMAEQMSTPRITAPYLDNFVGRVIMLVGKVTQLRGDQATLDSDGTVTVLLNRVC